MNQQIKLIKNNGNRELDDIEWIEEFYKFLQGDNPDGLTVKPKINLSKKKAWNIIWYLQEHLAVFPDNIEQCSVCGELFDNWRSGHYSELTGKHYCGEYCEPIDLYEKELKAEEKKSKKLK